MKRNISLLLMLLTLSIIGCASTAPMPETLNIIPPSPEVPAEIAAFSGIWEGKWNGLIDTILVVEEINKEKAEIIFSIGTTPGLEGRYIYATANFVSEHSIEWIDIDGSKIGFTMDKSLKKIQGYMEEKATGAKLWAYMTRRK